MADLQRATRSSHVRKKLVKVSPVNECDDAINIWVAHIRQPRARESRSEKEWDRSIIERTAAYKVLPKDYYLETALMMGHRQHQSTCMA